MIALFAALLPVFSQVERPYRAKVVIEEGTPAGDSVSRRTGAAIVKPGEALVAEVAGTRVLVRKGEWTEQGKALRVGGFHPLELWALDREAIRERFEVETVKPAAESPLPEGVAGPDGRTLAPLTARRPGRSLALASPIQEETPVLLRLVPRDPGMKERWRAIRAWMDSATGRLRRVEAETAAHRLSCALEAGRELDSVDDRWFEPDSKPVRLEEK